jgi:hypothetical protein
MKKYLIILLTILLSSCLTDNDCKEYIIKHKSEIKEVLPSLYGIKKYDGFYYTDITISDGRKYNMDSVYSVIFWGNRKSWLWNIYGDKYFTIDISYNKYKGKNVKLDNELYNLLK